MTPTPLTKEEAKALVLVARNRADYLQAAVAEVLASEPSTPVARALAEADALLSAAERIYDAHGLTDDDFIIGPDGDTHL